MRRIQQNRSRRRILAQRRNGAGQTRRVDRLCDFAREMTSRPSAAAPGMVRNVQATNSLMAEKWGAEKSGPICGIRRHFSAPHLSAIPPPACSVPRRLPVSVQNTPPANAQAAAPPVGPGYNRPIPPIRIPPARPPIMIPVRPACVLFGMLLGVVAIAQDPAPAAKAKPKEPKA